MAYSFSMTIPLLVQGLFHIFFSFMLLITGLKLYFQFKHTGNVLARNFSLFFFIGVFQFLMVAFAAFFLPNNLLIVRFIGAVVWLLSYVGLAYVWMAVAVIYPKAPLRLVLSVIFVVGSLVVYYYIRDFKPALISQIGLIDFDHPGVSLLVGNLSNVLTLYPVGFAFLYRTFKKRFFIKGLLFGGGLFITAFFMPLTNQVSNFSSYLLFNLLVALGLFFIAAAFAVVENPSLPTGDGQKPGRSRRFRWMKRID